MSLLWITINSQLENGIKLLNALNLPTFNVLLSHLSKSNNPNEWFTPEELNKLMQSLKLNKDQMQLLLQCIAHIYKQSCKVILKPTDLQQQLVETLKLDAAKAELFIKIWTEDAKRDCDFNNRSTLVDVTWELDLQTASSLCVKETVPQARIQLHLKNENQDRKENVLLTLDEDELIQLYNSLETIQVKLDNVNGNR